MNSAATSDYGVRMEVLPKHVYQTEDHISELPPLAKLCKIINITTPTMEFEIQKHTIKLLQTLTQSDPFVGEILSQTSNIDHILHVRCSNYCSISFQFRIMFHDSFI